MKRCVRCLLPENYYRISFNDEGVCNYCTNHKERQYMGEAALKADLEKFIQKLPVKSYEYDCIAGFSGGKDSTYLLYWLKSKLGLRVLAYSADNGFIPETTVQNVNNIARSLNVPLVYEKHAYFKKCYKHTILTWMKKPSLPMVETFCTGCRLGVFKGLLETAHEHKIPAIILGSNPFERVPYRENMLNIRHVGGNLSRVLGFGLQIIKNPGWLSSYSFVNTQFKEYIYYFNSAKVMAAHKIMRISPFWQNIHWNEKEILSTITRELNWQRNPSVVSTWRGDCNIALLKLYIYKKALGYNDKIDQLSHMIRDGQISREEGMKRLDQEDSISEEVLQEVMDNLGISYAEFHASMERLCGKPK